MHRLLRAAALPVNGGAGNAHRHAGSQPTGAGDVARQGADGVDATENHIVIFSRGDFIALDNALDHMGAEIGAMDLGERAIAPPGGRAQGINDIGLGHLGSPQDSGKVAVGPSGAASLNRVSTSLAL